MEIFFWSESNKFMEQFNCYILLIQVDVIKGCSSVLTAIFKFNWAS